MSDNALRLLRYAGFVTWILSGLPLAWQLLQSPDALNRPEYWLWLLWFAVFGASFALSAWRAAAFWTRPRQLLSLGVQAFAALAMIKLVCSGQEGALLVIVAAQLGWILPLGQALVWVGLQGLIMCVILGLFRPGDATLHLVSTYLGFQVLGLFSCFLTAREASARAALVKANHELRATRELLASASRSAERERISRELHDSLGHHLTALSLNLEAASHMSGGNALTQVSRAKQLVKALLQDVREVVAALRKRDSPQLGDALSEIARLIEKPRIHVAVPADLAIADSDISLTLLRCVQESVTNSIKHSDAENLWIELDVRAGRIEAHIADDGRGVGRVRPGHGLRGMRERVELVGGRMSIESRPGCGFDLTISLPAPAAVA